MQRLIFLILIFLSMGSYAADEASFASLKKKEVNWRTGPGEKYPIQWVYQEQGYPVKVLDSYDIWRQVQEADGSVGWVHKKMLSDRRTILVQEDGTLMTKPDGNGRVVAFIESGTIARILRCPAGSTDCLLSFKYQDDEVKGWFPRASVWGLLPGEEID